MFIYARLLLLSPKSSDRAPHIMFPVDKRSARSIVFAPHMSKTSVLDVFDPILHDVECSVSLSMLIKMKPRPSQASLESLTC